MGLVYHKFLAPGSFMLIGLFLWSERQRQRAISNLRLLTEYPYRMSHIATCQRVSRGVLDLGGCE